MSFAKIKDLNIYYENKGSGNNYVVLLHGWGQNTVMMDYIATFLSDNFNVYNLDFPGFGKSEEPKEPWSVQDYADFLAEFIRVNHIENPILIGHSFGCRVAIRYAYNHPVKKMCLTGAAGIRDKHGVDWYVKTYSYKAGKKILSLKPFEKYLKAMQDKAGSEDYKNASGVMRTTLVKVVNDDITDLLKDINVETLLVFGSNDEATPVQKGKMMEKLMPNATLIIFENDDHFAYFHEWPRFNAVLKAFLGEYYA